MSIVLTTALICGTIVYLAWRVEVWLPRWIDHRERVSAPSKPAVMDESAKMPPACLGLAMQESEPWAREAMLKAMRELYEVTGDWGIVLGNFTGERTS